MRNEREEKVEKHQRREQVESAIKIIKCSSCSQEPYGAPANPKGGAESIEVRAAKKRKWRLQQVLRDCPRFEVMRTQTTKSSFVSLVDHLLYITLRINTCHCMYRLWALPVYCTVSGNSLTTCSTEIKCVTPQHATTVSQAFNQKCSIRYVSRSNIQYMCCDTLWDCSEGQSYSCSLCLRRQDVLTSQLTLRWSRRGWRLLQYCASYLNKHFLPTLPIWHSLLQFYGAPRTSSIFKIQLADKHFTYLTFDVVKHLQFA